VSSSASKRKTILNAALQLISEKGFHGTAMSKLAKEANVSVGIIYHYFQNKDELMHDLFREINRDLANMLIEAHDSSQPLKTQIMRLWRLLVEFYLKNPQHASFIQQYKNSPYYSPEMDAETDGYFDFLFEIGQQALQEKIVKDLPRQVFYSLCLDFAGTLSQKHAKGMLTLTEDLMDKIVDATWDAIKL
jgi:AcrR family transcriptional regulator